MTTQTQHAPNLVPTIESTMLPTTPANEWADRMTTELDSSAALARERAPTEKTDMVPGAYPGGDEGDEKEAALPMKEEDVQRTITSVGQMVKDLLPEAVKAYLPSSTSPTSSKSASLSPSAPKLSTADSQVSTVSVATNLSTEAQAGSLLPPRLDSEAPDAILGNATPTPRASLPTPAQLGIPPSIHPDDTASDISTRVHTGENASRDPIAPLAHVPDSLGLPTPPARTPSPGVGDSRFVERLSSISASEMDMETETGTPRQVDLGLLHTTSPEPLSASSSDIHEGIRAPAPTMQPELQPQSQPQAKLPAADGMQELVQRGAPNALPPTPPLGISEPVPAPGEEVEAGADSDEDGEDGGEETEEKRERKRDRLLKKFKKTMHVGGGSA